MRGSLISAKPARLPRPAIFLGAVISLAVALPLAIAAQDAPAWTRGATCCEVFVRSFVDSDGDGVGDLKGLTSRLDHIDDGKPRSTRSLGARCIWRCPATNRRAITATM